MDLVGMGVRENRRQLRMTVLHRPGGVWHKSEVAALVNNLKTEISQHPQHGEYLVLYGEFSKERTLAAMGGGVAYTAKLVVGSENDQLPFRPSFF